MYIQFNHITILIIIFSLQEQVVINPGGNQKESVLMRLGNRIRQVEKNQELNSAYLEDLSQRW